MATCIWVEFCCYVVDSRSGLASAHAGGGPKPNGGGSEATGAGTPFVVQRVLTLTQSPAAEGAKRPELALGSCLCCGPNPYPKPNGGGRKAPGASTLLLHNDLDL
jgi:hypothetical protein